MIIFLIELMFLSAIVLFSVTTLKTLLDILAHVSRYRRYTLTYPGVNRGRAWQFTK